MRNILDRKRNVISEELRLALETEGGSLNLPKYKNKEFLDFGLYLIGFRLLNKESNVYVYAHHYYDDIFTEPFLCFLENRNYNRIRFTDWGDSLVIINEDVISNFADYSGDDFDAYIARQENKRFFINNNQEFESNIQSLRYINHVDSPIQFILEMINKFNYVTKHESGEMLKLWELAANKDYLSYINHLFGQIPNFNLEDALNKENIHTNLLHGCVFVTQDGGRLIRSLKGLGYNVNKGPKEWRAEGNSVRHQLDKIDGDFRESLYRHHIYHSNKSFLGIKTMLDKSKFSYRNINMNIGNIKLYSTSTSKLNSIKLKDRGSELSKKLLNKVSTKSFKVDSEIYLYLSRYLKESPINENTQRSIEKFLLDYSYLSIQGKKETNNNKNLIEYDLFGNQEVKKYFLTAYDYFQDYLRNFCHKKIKISERSYNKTITRTKFQNIVKTIGFTAITDMALGIVVRIISNDNKLNEDSTETNIAIELGDSIIKNYFYILYKNNVKENILLFYNTCKEYIINNKESLHLDGSEYLDILDALNKVKEGINKLEVYEMYLLVKKILSFKNMSMVNFNNTESILGYSLSDWRSDNIDFINQFEDSTFKLGISSIVIEWLFDCDMLEQSLIFIGRNKKHISLVPHKDLRKFLNEVDLNKVKHLPSRIPMIVKPKPYNRKEINGKVKETLGGYLLNDELISDKIIISNWELRDPSLIKEPNVVYELVNNVNSVGFKVNTELLDFINLYGNKLGLLPYDVRLDDKVNKFTEKEYEELESFRSKYELQENILGLAKVFSDIPEFYLPVRLDFRGRMNCVSQYFNYQSTELAKSLLLFSKCEKLMKNDSTGINYFKAYGGSCFGNKIDKLSWSDRCEWLDHNEEDIINYTNFNLISKAENKFLFTAYCIEYNKWIKACNNHEIPYFETYLPIQLDASCNGFQHLCLLTYDNDMAKELNLTESKWVDIPKDFYKYLAIKLIELFKTKLHNKEISEEDKACYNRLANITILRTTVKKAIMTVPYNVSVYQMIKYLKEHFNNNTDNSGEAWSQYKLQYQYKEDPNVMLCSKDISFIASGLKEVLSENFPKLKLLIIYLKSVTNICNKLKIIIPWETPSGMLLNQSYLSSKEIRLQPYSYNKRSFTLKVATDKLRTAKQGRALMPNLIHSLDASVLALLADDLFNTNNLNNFYSIHDCFAVTANNIPKLFSALKSIYTKIYTQDIFLRNFDNFIRSYIKVKYGDSCFNENNLKITAIVDDKEVVLQFPSINQVLGSELPSIDLITKSSYLIS
jgi:hypothetical protein